MVNILTSGDPINAEDVSQLAQDEGAASGTGQVAKGGPAAKAQVRQYLQHMLITHDAPLLCCELYCSQQYRRLGAFYMSRVPPTCFALVMRVCM